MTTNIEYHFVKKTYEVSTNLKILTTKKLLFINYDVIFLRLLNGRDFK